MSFLTEHQAAALSTLRQTWAEDELVIVGAAALRYHFGEQWRETRDLDLTIATSMQAYAAVLEGLRDWQHDARMEQRWIAPHGVRIDIIPVSDESLAAGELLWPNSGFRMSLRGFGLAFEYGEPVAVGSGSSVLVASVPTIVVLKMAAYLDRPAERERDLHDLAFLLEQGVGADDEDRYHDRVIDAGLTYEEAGPFALGRRVAAIAGVADRQLVSDFLRFAETAVEPPFVLELLASSGPATWNREVSEARVRLNAFGLGMASGD